MEISECISDHVLKPESGDEHLRLSMHRVQATLAAACPWKRIQVKDLLPRICFPAASEDPSQPISAGTCPPLPSSLLRAKVLPCVRGVLLGQDKGSSCRKVCGAGAAVPGGRTVGVAVSWGA